MVKAACVVHYHDYRRDDHAARRQEPITSSTLSAVSGSGTWPQVFIGGKLIGGAADPDAYFAARKAA